jgi:hypothetical protein
MTPEKINEAFETWFLEYPSWRVTMSRQESCEKAWQACAEWILSQANEKEFDLAICSEWQGTLTEYELSQVKNVWMIARLSSAKEIASLKDQILRYEQDNRELRVKGIKEIAEKQALITKTRNDREAQYKLGCDTQSDLNKANEELFFTHERIKALESELHRCFQFLWTGAPCDPDDFPLVKEIASKKEST